MDYEQFTSEFKSLSGIDLQLYKEKQMHRRIDTLIDRKKLRGYDEFADILKHDPIELEEFKHYITINVTEFFRTPDEWKTFEKEALSELAGKQQDTLKVWSCACATGEEPYSLAMSLAGLTDTDRFRILATDLDTDVLAKAESGLFTELSAETLPEETRDRFFTKKGKLYQINDDIRNTVEFRHFDLLQDEFPTDLDLIVCRNVLIYFTDPAKDRIYGQFIKCLKPGGFLFTGKTEQIVYYKNYGYRKISNFLYRKPEAD